MFSPTLYSAVLVMVLTGLLAAHGVHSGSLDSAPDCSLVNGGIIQPAADTLVSNGGNCPIRLRPGRRLYQPVSQRLHAYFGMASSHSAISDSLNTSHEFDDFLLHFGDYKINNLPSESSLKFE